MPPEEDGLVFVNLAHPQEIKSAATQRAIRRRDPVDRHPFLCLDPCNTTVYPTPLDHRALQLMHFVTGDTDYVFRPLRTVWFSMALTDASAVLVALANAAMLDITGSIVDDSPPPRLPRPSPGIVDCLDTPPACLPPTLQTLLDGLAPTSEPFTGIATAFALTIHTVHRINEAIHSDAFWKHENNTTVIELLAPPSHYLLCMTRPHDPAGVELLREAIRLTLLLLLAALKRDIFLFTAHEWDCLQGKFAVLVRTLRETELGVAGLKLYLWTLVTVSMLDLGWYLDETQRVRDRLHLGSGEAMDIVRGVLWVDALQPHLDSPRFKGNMYIMNAY
ncbi:hypothetical protein BO71DRAFT_432080 [Aspergillus ellipticus CBS 707.79]|uniref:Uncharacterized protein n=1 Tax=Aspergillus ellipticus CBS 707.79 TaxID=1448320 RepID=A0A319DDB8_9EURO|nr:hypothetical protein BO71DRAFT_432080 [Aspergillus ellipticus CBS 707.79]